MSNSASIDPHKQGEVIGAISLDPIEQDGDLTAKIRALVH
jgi:hypothetical protein